MEESAHDIMKSISDWGKIFLYLLIGLVALFGKRAEKRRKQQPRQFDAPEEESESVKPAQQPAPTVVKHTAGDTKKRSATSAAGDKRYFTYENEADYKAKAAERKEQAEKQAAKENKSGNESAAAFDLRAAVIASEILKPKFEE